MRKQHETDKLNNKKQGIGFPILVKQSKYTFPFLPDEPEIEVEAEKVHSGVGKEAHLTCIVHGEPRPSVSFVEVSRFDGIHTFFNV